MNANASTPLARLFIGLWPDDAVRAAVWSHAERWSWPPSARRVPDHKLHLTLHFLGGVPRERVSELAHGLRVPFEPFALRLDRAEVWPNQVAVLQPSSVPQPLQALHGRLQLALARLAIASAHERLVPHVTLARHAKGAVAPADTAIDWPVAGYLLIESIPGAGYQPLHAYA